MVTVYALKDSSGKVRYIGQTTKSLQYRLRGHVMSARRKRWSFYKPVNVWIRSVNYKVQICALKENAVPNVDEAIMIDRYRRLGASLTNCSFVKLLKPDPIQNIQTLEHRRRVSASRSTISSAQIEKARELYLSGVTFAKISSILGVPYKTAYNAVHGRRV